MAHPVMWFEVLGKDGSRLRKFYSGLFGWGFGASDPIEYGIVNTGDSRGIPGGIGQSYPGTRPWVTFYVETPDVTASLKQAETLGGKMVLPRTALPGATVGAFEDPEGHVVGLVEGQTS